MAIRASRLIYRIYLMLPVCLLFTRTGAFCQLKQRVPAAQVITFQQLFDSVKYPVRWDLGVLDPSQKIYVHPNTPFDTTLLYVVCIENNLECTRIGNNFSIKRKKSTTQTAEP